MLYSFFLITINVGCSSAFRPRYPTIYYIILSRKPRGWKFFRTVYFFLQVISGIALAALWRSIYNADTGLLNGLLRAMGMGELACDWLGGLETAFPAVLIYWVFYVGYYIIL